jgi:hypothetical protein
MDSAEEDLKRSGFNNRKTKAEKRMEWSSVFGAVMAGMRLYTSMNE